VKKSCKDAYLNIPENVNVKSIMINIDDSVERPIITISHRGVDYELHYNEVFKHQEHKHESVAKMSDLIVSICTEGNSICAADINAAEINDGTYVDEYSVGESVVSTATSTRDFKRLFQFPIIPPQVPNRASRVNSGFDRISARPSPVVNRAQQLQQAQRAQQLQQAQRAQQVQQVQQSSQAQTSKASDPPRSPTKFKLTDFVHTSTTAKQSSKNSAFIYQEKVDCNIMAILDNRDLVNVTHDKKIQPICSLDHIENAYVICDEGCPNPKIAIHYSSTPGLVKANDIIFLYYDQGTHHFRQVLPPNRSIFDGLVIQQILHAKRLNTKRCPANAINYHGRIYEF